MQQKTSAPLLFSCRGAGRNVKGCSPGQPWLQLQQEELPDDFSVSCQLEELTH